MTETILIVGFAVAGAALFVGLINSFRKDGYVDGYRQGQIDAANGKQTYHKDRNEDGEEVWTKKTQEK